MSARTVAEIVAPFSRLPAGVVASLADALLERLADAHDGARFGCELSPSALPIADDGSIALTSAAQAAPWLAAPERRALAFSEQPATAADDLFALGAVLLELLIGRRPLDAGSVEANAAFRARLVAPPPVFALWPTVPGFLERLLVSLLAPDPARRAPSAAAARAMLAPFVAQLREREPELLAALVRDPAGTCARVHEQQARAEAERGAAFVSVPATIKRGLVCLLRAHALLPGQPQVTQLLTQAAQAGAIRGARPPPAELAALLAQIAAAEPAPPAALLRSAATLHEQCGDLLEAIGLMRRALTLQPGNKVLVARLDELGAPSADAAGLWSAAGAWALEAIPAVRAAHAHVARIAALDNDAPEPPWRQALRSGAQIYASVEPRSRLFLLVLAFGALTSVALFGARSASQGGSMAARAQLDVLATQGADCPPGGRAVLLQAWQAARLHEPEAIDQLIENNESLVPMGTRCHAYALDLSAQAAIARRSKR